MISSHRRISGVIIFTVLVSALAALLLWWLGPRWQLSHQQSALIWLLITATAAALMAAVRYYRQDMPQTPGTATVKSRTDQYGEAEQLWIQEMRDYLYHRYGRGWKRKMRVVVLTGHHRVVQNVISGLLEAQWLEANGVVAVWGGNLTSGAESVRITALRKLKRCPVSAIVLAYDAALRQAMPTDTVARQLTERCKKLGWQVPLYLWEVQDYVWPQQERETQPVGVLLPAHASLAELAAALQTLPAQLTEPGIRQGMNNSHFAFLLQLSAMLRDGAAEQFQRLSQPLLTGPYSMPLRGVMFSPPVTAKEADKQRWLPDNSWQRILDDLPGLRIRRAGFAWERVGYQTVLAALLVLWGGLLLSWWTNHRAMSEAQQLVQAAADTSLPENKRLISLGQLQRKVDQLDWRRQHGTPRYSRLGLSQNDTLLNTLWPHYARIALPELRDGAVQHLSQALERWSTLPVNDPQRAEQSKEAYGWLKAYLMLSHPQKMDAALFADTVMRVWPQREGVSHGLWQAEGAKQLGFMAQHLPEHTGWQIKPDMPLVSASRSALLRTIGMRNSESAQYQKVLAQVSHNYADLSLQDLTGDTDAGRLFASDSVVSGMFTRQAWEGAVHPAIEKVVNERREEIDWVLSDSEQPSGSENSPEMLKARLTERYFTDYAGACQDFLNGIRWQQADTLSDAIDQLTLLADVRQSPLVALMNTLNQQGRTGQMREALSDSLVKSAKNLLNSDQQNNIDQKSGPRGPMDATFGPVLSLMDRSNDSGSSLSLQTFLTRVTRVRLKLQQVTGAADPQAMMQALAQTVFRGKSVDITDTRDYGSLVAASLGQEWSGFGQAVFVQPMVQAWQQVLAPTASSINSQWQTSIVQDWESDFNDRWPFSRQKQSEASLPLLSQYLRNDTGRVTQFVKENLGGVLRKEGRRWVPDDAQSATTHSDRSG